MGHDIQPAYPPQRRTNLPISQVRVKICGLTNLDDALVAIEAGADLLGFIFYEKSPRYVMPAQVRDIVAQLRSADHRSPITGPRTVGVFVNPRLEQVIWALDDCGLDLAQLHGEEPPELLAALPGRVFKAVRPATPAAAEADAGRYARFGPVAGPDLLIDAYHPTMRGGTGIVGDWALAAGLVQRCRVLLAGGLTPDNVAEAVRQVRPWGVDVAGGVELAPGRKDHGRVRAFVAAARGPVDNHR
jgi:phosphoribosylanthranilate isomerase